MMCLTKLPNQRPDEKVELFLRRHWIEVLQLGLLFTFLFAIPLVFAIRYASFLKTWFVQPLLGPLSVVLLSLYFLGIWLFTFEQFSDYYLDTWIVTNKRVINIEQVGLFRRTASELHLADIQDATSDVSGILHSMLNYGDVVVQTASAAVHFHFKDVPNPEIVKHTVLKLVDIDRRRHGREPVVPAPVVNKLSV